MTMEMPILPRANHTSTWLMVGVLLPAATMMHPTFASLIAIGVIIVLLFALRWVAHMEGYAAGKAAAERKVDGHED